MRSGCRIVHDVLMLQTRSYEVVRKDVPLLTGGLLRHKPSHLALLYR